MNGETSDVQRAGDVMRRQIMANTDRRPVTLGAIARAAGVSIPTVSRVLNAQKHVSSGTRQKVERLLVAAGYRIKSLDDTLPPLIDVVVPSLHSPYIAALLGALDDAVAGHDLSLVLTTSSRDRDWLHVIARRPTRGVIMILGEYSVEQARWFHCNGIPTVLIDPCDRPSNDTPWVMADNFHAGREATRHLIDLGHRRIGYIKGVSAEPGRDRHRGYLAAMHAATLPARGYSAGATTNKGSVLLALDILLSRPDPPTAIVADHDQLALILIAVATDLGLRIPQDFSIIGFDEVVNVATESPELTTMRHPLDEMAVQAIQILLGTMAPRTARVAPKMQLVIRDSTAPPGEQPTRTRRLLIDRARSPGPYRG